jgi:nucleotidyltransferase substrate binding protein (TIGR01987 family)
MTELDSDIRWKQRFENLQASYAQLIEAIDAHKESPTNTLIPMALIKAFEMTFELSWKTMKDYLTYNGIDAKMPREVIKQAFAFNIVNEGQPWINMLEDRNLMSHTYDNVRATLAVQKICGEYVKALSALQDYFLERLN